ncbi:MAG: T9SS type A sorting domain-containing protein, partial [Candidatus Symbiothrix sp.]|nr:T9SS type A sorting domain-containing protein [Candidatus Symbiothrix sp.]
YESFEIDIYYGTSGDNYHKDVKYSVNSGSKTKIDATGDNLGVWKTLIIPVNVSGGNTFTFEIGYHANSGANFYLDNFKMKEKTGSGGGGGGGDIGESSVFEDFESKNINDAYDMKRWYPEDGSAIVGADPADSNGKSVHILTSNWDAFLKMNIALPSGKTLSDYETFSFDIYIVNNSDDEYPNYKNMAIYLDDEKKYEESDYPGQAEIATWTTKIYSLSDWSLSNEEMGKSSFSLAFGLSTDHGDYYIDNVALTEKGGGSVFIPSVRASNIIDWSKADYIQVYNIGGQLLNSNLSSVSALSDGCYILKAQIEGQRAIGKIIISK